MIYDLRYFGFAQHKLWIDDWERPPNLHRKDNPIEGQESAKVAGIFAYVRSRNRRSGTFSDEIKN
ncbi:MAG: hypothetical protein GY805_22200 [Chloroflexi bacterium]|nr:hypothetical protein [Chloroflexota bacterium]